MKRFLIVILLLGFIGLQAQDNPSEEDALFIKTIYNHSLQNSSCYSWLEYLTTKIGGRLAGSPASMAAVFYTKQMLDTLGVDRTELQSCEVPHWSRGIKEEVRIVNSSQYGSKDLKALALGNSIGTGTDGLSAEVVEVKSLDEVKELGKKNVEGKIIFYNRPMDPTQVRTFNAYGGAVDQRVYGASTAAEYGAVAVLVRSMTTKLDDVPHTGTLVYKEKIDQIPALAISTNDSELLSRLLKKEKIEVYIRNTSHMLSPKESYNVIAEIKGSEFPDEIILVGGHLDAWDVGQGAHDDGSGCVQSMEVINTLKKLNYKPKRTIRCVLFMNEENGLGGGLAYAKKSNENNEFHLAAIESDAGGFTPRGFSCDAEADVFNDKYKSFYDFLPLMEPYGINFKKGGSGADISPLKSQKGLLIGLRPDSQRYFDYHHTTDDVFQVVNQRELELGAAAMTSIVYLIDKYGL